MTGHADDGAVYELTVSGPLGPVFRAALEPYGVAESPGRAVIVALPRPGRDLVGLVDQLRDAGLGVESIVSVRRLADHGVAPDASPPAPGRAHGGLA